MQKIIIKHCPLRVCMAFSAFSDRFTILLGDVYFKFGIVCQEKILKIFR